MRQECTMEHEVAAQLGEPVTSSVKLMPQGR